MLIANISPFDQNYLASEPPLDEKYVEHIRAKIESWIANTGHEEVSRTRYREVLEFILHAGRGKCPGSIEGIAIPHDVMERHDKRMLASKVAHECIHLWFWQFNNLVQNEWTDEEYDKERAALEGLTECASLLAKRFFIPPEQETQSSP